MYQISVTALPVKIPGVYRWCLDFPKTGQAFEEPELLEKGLNFQGWVLPQEGCEAKPYFRLGAHTRYLPLEATRTDVIERVLKEPVENNPKVRCGFQENIPVNSSCGFFGFEVDGARIDVVKVEVLGSLRIIEGREGWLFLDNDSNQSVDQYKGNLLLGKLELREWSTYLDNLRKNAQALSLRHALLIAPAKEMVLSDFYPHKKGKTSPVEQVLALTRPEHHVVHPVAELESSEFRTFRMCDTHWTSKGAMLGLLAVLRELGLDPVEAAAVFEADKYKETMHSGDLGSKVFPSQSAKELVLTGAHYRKWVEYDNFLPNMGRVIVIRNTGAPYPAKCMIFGSSSSYSFFDYISRVFSEVIFIHSAGSIDFDVVAAEKPDYLIAQTNGRFVVRPPSTEYSLAGEIADKWERLDSASRSRVTEKYSFREGGADSTLSHFHRMLPFVA
ncbi:hypothetical protein [Microbulbifer hydrolyticus]|uniref:AlgX/AlgJ SGNH hydrolase-like domain-containing protein n=1 Tax=Microbulbifer hydrolyticus TaxID=48074 RepID=A0A6P1TB01_9GAMM|nr:hypothetical protein [Microbulbifer hydrolyticus]MBB5212301.1 hypothetical protein [Microbulbifer hydrolyticus]QHQ39948.1 hypothetical protein GTQ55_13785 [Microbulbifer hydrolyticus]